MIISSKLKLIHAFAMEKFNHLLWNIMFLATASLWNAGCGNNCTPSSNVTCTETPPSGEPCAAYFERWFYHDQTKSCTQIGYSGCSQRGFATQQECEACKCQE